MASQQRCDRMPTIGRRMPRIFLSSALALGLVVAGCAVSSGGQGQRKSYSMKGGQGMMMPSGLHAFTMAKARNSSPPDRLGGPLTVIVSQTNGKGRFNLPGTRRLDPAVFGAPVKPTGFEPAPFPMLGIPDGNNDEGEPWRLTSSGKYTIVNHFSPFSDWYVPGKATVNMTVTDAQAIDGIRTKDRIDFSAEFSLPDGAKYRVVVKRPIPHGKAFPFFGGVVTNHLIHGSANVAPKLLPTTYAYVAFWGMGEVYKNGQTLKHPKNGPVTNQLVH